MRLVLLQRSVTRVYVTARLQQADILVFALSRSLN